jgi:protein gp37
MAENSKIEWTDHTFNPWMGCANCYAERDFDHRYGKVKWGNAGTRVVTSDANWKKPLQWDREAAKAGERKRVFCASLADVFENWEGPMLNAAGEQLFNDDQALVPTSMANVRLRLFDLIDQTPNLDWLLLTKRPENISRMWRTYFPGGYIAEAGLMNQEGPRPNVWLGASVESADYLHRIDTLKSCGDLASVLFLSCEPVVGPMLTLGEHIDGIDWIITGGESGPSARPADPDWFRSIRDQCAAHDVPFHFKQWGEFDEHQVRVGKKNAGRLLDGLTHDGLPIVQTV